MKNERWSFPQKGHENTIFSANVLERWSFHKSCPGIQVLFRQKAVFSKISIKRKSRSQLSRQFVEKRFQVPTIIFNPLSWLGRSPMSTFEKKKVPRLTYQVLLYRNSPSSLLPPPKKRLKPTKTGIFSKFKPWFIFHRELFI